MRIVFDANEFPTPPEGYVFVVAATRVLLVRPESAELEEHPRPERCLGEDGFLSRRARARDECATTMTLRGEAVAESNRSLLAGPVRVDVAEIAPPEQLARRRQKKI